MNLNNCDLCDVPILSLNEPVDCPLCVPECPCFGIGPHEGPDYDEVKRLVKKDESF